MSLLAARGAAPRRWPRPLSRGRGLPVVEAAIVLLATAATAGALHALIGAADVEATSPVARGVGSVWAALMLALAGAAQLVQRRATAPWRSRVIVAALAGAAAAVVVMPMMVGLHGTNQPPFTILRGDQTFRTEYVTRFAATWHLQDYTFRGLHAFYPPAWFWLAGRTAHVFGITPWHVLKPFTILTVGAALLLAYALWRSVLSPAGALTAAVGSSLVLPAQVGILDWSTQAWYSPYSCFVAVTGVAWLAATLHAVRARGSRGRLALLGLVGAALALLYYLLFVILVVVLIALVAIPREGRRPALRRVGAVCGGIAVLTAVFWVPLVDVLVNGSASQGRFLRPDFLQVSVGLGGPVALAVLAVVAIAVLGATFSSPASQAVAGLLAGTVLYQLVSVTTLVFSHNQFQPHRAVAMMWATYGAAVPVALEGLRKPGAFPRTLPPAVPRALAALTLVVAGAATFALGATQGSDLAGGPFARAAHRRLAFPKTEAISRFITQTTGKRPQQLTVLTGDRALLVTEPYYGFLPLRFRYAHPQAAVDQRVALLRSAAACLSPACTTRRLTASRFGAIDALVLARTPFGYRVDTEASGFPRPVPVVVVFTRSSFDPAVWARRDFGVYTAFVRRPV